MEINIDNHPVYVSTGHEEINNNKPYVIFIHGAGLDHTVWVLFNRYFSRNGFNSLAVDLPGHGKSGGEVLSSVEENAAWLIRFMQDAGIESCSLVGHSMGALIALETTAQAQDKINNLLLLGIGVPMLVSDVLLDAARNKDHAAIDMITLYGHGYASQLGGNPVAGINIVNNNMRILERGLDVSLYTDLNACNEYKNGLQAAENITCPTTLILGREDRMTPPASATELISTLENVKTEMIPACGHMMMAESPETVHLAMVSAINRRSSE